MQMYLQRFTVEGTGAFPFDMLRYDCAFPEYEQEAHLFHLTHADRKDFTTPRKIHLERYSRLKTRGPTEARWESFGWHVTQWSIVP